eukprot:Gb_37163 [translate_table: standard]
MAPCGGLLFYFPCGLKVDLIISNAGQWNPHGPKSPEILTHGMILSLEPTKNPIHESAGKKGFNSHLKELERAPLIDPINVAHLEDAQSDTPPSMVEKAQGRGEETHHRIRASLEKINEWESKLATLRSMARRNLPLDLSLLQLDEVITYEIVLAKLGNARLPPVVKLDNSFPLEVERAQCVKEFLGPILADIPGLHLRQLPKSRNPSSTPYRSIQIITGVKRRLGHTSIQFMSIDSGRALYRYYEVEPNTMEHRVEKSSLEEIQGVHHSPTHIVYWEAYLMAKEMIRSLEAYISDLDKSVKAMQEELRQFKDVTQGISNIIIHILHELSHIGHHLSLGARRRPHEDEANSTRSTLEKPNGESLMHSSRDHKGQNG